MSRRSPRRIRKCGVVEVLVTMRTSLAVLFVGCSITFSSSARASDVAADRLYEEGRQAAQRRDWPLACRKFKESEGLEPAPGTLLNLGDCEEHLGALVDAVGHFTDAAQRFRPGDERVAYARQRAAAVQSRIPVLTLRLRPGTPARVHIECDEIPVAGIGVPQPVNPGEHVLIVQLAGHTPVRTTVRIAEGENREIELGVGGPTPSVAAPTVPLDDSAHSHDTVTGAPLRSAALVSFGVGAVALGFGIAGGVVTLGAKSTVDNPQNCTSTCNVAGQAAEARGKTWSAVSTAGFIGAGVGALAGATLLIASPRRDTGGVRSTAFSVLPIGDGALVSGTVSF
jgi:hypothetical protein